MQTMKQYLALIATLTAAVCHAQAAPAGRPPPDVRQVAVQKPAAVTEAAPRQLSAQERAELRRQIYQYSRVAGKTS